MPAEANAAAAAAVALIKGKKPKANSYHAGRQEEEPTVALPVVWITKANSKRLFTDGFLKRSRLRRGRTSGTASRLDEHQLVEDLGASTGVW